MEKLFDRIAYSAPEGVKYLVFWLLLLPLHLASILYGMVVKSRLFFYKTGFMRIKEVGCKVISVGNITVGGTGKTPTVEFIARILQKRGFRVAILSRGYRGNAGSKPGIVSDGNRLMLSPDEAGDEPYMLAKRLKTVPVLIGKDRYDLGMYAVSRFSPDVLILDDGFQHIKLRRDLDILLVDSERGFGNGYLTPRGPLREPLSGINRSDIILINKKSSQCRGIDDFIRDYYPGKDLFESSYRPTKMRCLWMDDNLDTIELDDAKVVALSALADPASFSSLLSTMGSIIVADISYSDHHSYTTRDIESVIKAAKKAGADCIVTTEKDAVKLEQLDPAQGIPFYCIQIEMEIDGGADNLIDIIVGRSGLDEEKAETYN